MPLELTENAKSVLSARYLWRDPQGQEIETPEGLFERVAQAVAATEGRKASQWAERFLELMLLRRFLPNSPTLMNAGRTGGQLSACYVLPVGDSLDSIFDTLKFAARIHQSGGGTGFSFSRIRPKGSRVQSTLGVASGPVSFIKVFDVATETIKQGGARRGANMAVLRVDHPDILEFIDSKRDQRSITNFNISVAATDAFMRAAVADQPYWLRDPRTGEGLRQLGAGEVLERVVQAAWECGDPGMVFLDRVNLMNPTPEEGELESTNPCGEQPLLPFESCNLGSLNLGEYWDGSAFLWEDFGRDIETATRFLDDVVDLNAYPLEESRRITLRNRKIGLGVMGFADLLLMQGVPYASEEALGIGERLMSFLDRRAKETSARLAQEKGAFPGYPRSLWKRLGYPPLRNATLTTVAPTGTISIIAGASSGIEPIFSGVFYRNVLSGQRLIEIHPAVEKAFRARGIVRAREASDQEIAAKLGAAWSPAQSVPVEAHVRMQAMFQRFSDSAVSKTINLPRESAPSDVREAYLRAYSLGCKGITVYRDQSRPSQVLERTQGSPKPPGGESGAPACDSCND